MENSEKPEGTSSQQFSADKLKETLGRYVNHKFIMERAREVITNPRGCWTSIKEDARPMKQTYQDYLLVLAAIPPLAAFIKSTLIGYPYIGRANFLSSLFYHVLMYGVILGVLWVGAIIIEKLAPKFDGSADNMSAFKLLAYSLTPYYLAGVFSLFGMGIGLLALLVSLYGFYIYYVGIPEMTTVPEQKRVGFFAVSTVAIVVTFIVGMGVAGAIAGPIYPKPFKSINIQGGNLNIDPARLQKDLERLLPGAK